MSAFWDAMAPFPPGDKSQVISVFTVLILGVALVSMAGHIRLLLQAFRLHSLIRELTGQDEGLDCQDDVDKLSLKIRKACPLLDVPAQGFRKSTFERNHQAYATVSAASIFESHLPGGRPGAGLVPASILLAGPLFLISLGLLAGLVGFMEIVAAAPIDDTSLGLGALVVQSKGALRVVAWGLFMATLIYVTTKITLRVSATGGSRLVDWIDTNLKQGSDEDLHARLFKLQERSEQNLTRSAKTLDILMELQQGTARHLLDNKETVESLGRSIQSSFSDSIQRELGPMLEEMSKQALATSLSSQNLIDQASQQQVESIERIIATVVEGIDKAVGENLRVAGETMATVAVQQTETVQDWAEAVRKMGTLVGELHQISNEMQHGAKAISSGVLPIGEAATNFLSASSKLYEVLPSIQGASDGYLQAQTGLVEIARVLQTGTQSLQLMSENQTQELDLWRERADTMTSVLNRVESAMGQMEEFSQVFAEASGPTREAAQAFAQVSEAITQSIPGLHSSLQAQAQVTQTIQSAATQINEGTAGYFKAAEIVSALMDQLQTAHQQSSHQQQTSFESQELQLKTWSDTIQSTQPMIQQTQALLGQLQQATGDLSGFTSELRDASGPTREAAQAFEAITQVIQEAIPTIASSVTSHGKVGAAIDHAASHLEKSTGGYLEAAQLVRSLVTELNESHRKISGHRKESDAAQSAHLNAWNQAMNHLQPTVQQLDMAVKGLQGGIHDIGQFTASLATAAAPTALAAESFRKVSEVMESAIPAFHSNMVSQEAMRKAIDEAARRIQHGTTGYLQAADLVRQVVSEIDQSQEDLSRARSLDRSAQNEQLAAWETALDRLLPALEALKRTTTDLDGLSSSFANAAHPAIEAGAAFHNAALEANRILPQLESARDGYEAINTALSSTAQELARSSQSYTAAGAQVGEILGQLETSMSLQNAGNEQLEKTLDRASRFTEQLPEASKMVIDAAQGLQGASLRTAEVVSSITDAVKVQDDTVGQMKDTAKVLVSVLQRQSGQWEQFHSEMDRLQHVLDTSVDTFTKQMPEAIDHTLVHFDAALAEGVERLGSAVERLREAMDDLQERLEQVLEKA